MSDVVRSNAMSHKLCAASGPNQCTLHIGPCTIRARYIGSIHVWHAAFTLFSRANGTARRVIDTNARHTWHMHYSLGWLRTQIEPINHDNGKSRNNRTWFLFPFQMDYVFSFAVPCKPASDNCRKSNCCHLLFAASTWIGTTIADLCVAGDRGRRYLLIGCVREFSIHAVQRRCR